MGSDTEDVLELHEGARHGPEVGIVAALGQGPAQRLDPLEPDVAESVGGLNQAGKALVTAASWFSGLAGPAGFPNAVDRRYGLTLRARAPVRRTVTADLYSSERKAKT